MSRVPQQVRLDPEILLILKQIADEDGEPNVSLVIRRALRQSPIIKARLEARRQLEERRDGDAPLDSLPDFG